MQHILMAILLLIISPTVGKSQIKRGNYCECKTASLLDMTQRPDSIFASIRSDSSFYVVKIYNTTADTLFLFSSYLQQQFFSSKYLHRINLNKKQYKLSFVPIIPFVFTKYSDVIATSNIIVGDHQVVYDFIKMQPNSYYEFMIPIEDAFPRGDVSEDFNPNGLNKFDYNTKFKKIPTKKVAGNKYNRLFEFAFYKDVTTLCKESDYYLRENDFKAQAKSFIILQVPVK
jgi:hypothetical protein